MDKEIKEQHRFYVSSWHKKTDHNNYVGVVAQDVTVYADGSESTEVHIRKHKDPIRPFFVTKECYRGYEYKKEFEQLDHCDKFMVHDSELEDRLARILGEDVWKRPNLRQLCQSPYVYAADISTETLVKRKYAHDAPIGRVAQFTRGGLDIETEISDKNRIIAITYTHEHQVYTAVLREYCKTYPDGDKGASVPAHDDEILSVVDKLIGSFMREHGFELTLHIADDEISVIKWIFDRIHECKTNFIGVWNMSFDIPTIMARIEDLGYSVEDIMCHPDIPANDRMAEYHEDRGKPEHFTDRWDWVSISGYSQFVDSMCLYARLRKVAGREPSYSLDAISNKELGTGKLHFGEITNHWYMQNYRFLEYIAYNINDVLIMAVMEWKTNDIVSLSALSGLSLMRDFSHQTTLLRNDAYDYGIDHNMLVSATGYTMRNQYDYMQAKAGGTVLPPEKATGVGSKIIAKSPWLITSVSLFCNDLDYSSMYPSTTSMANISKETALATVVKINGKPRNEVQQYFSYVFRPSSGAYGAATKFYGLDTYGQMSKRFAAYLANKRT